MIWFLTVWVPTPHFFRHQVARWNPGLTIKKYLRKYPSRVRQMAFQGYPPLCRHIALFFLRMFVWSSVQDPPLLDHRLRMSDHLRIFFSESGQALPTDCCVIERIWGNWGEYMLLPKWRVWALKELGVDHLILGVDLFSTPWTSAAPKFITKEMDSFGYDWSSLIESDSHFLWANPPFALLDRVAAKASCEPIRLALVTPVWEERPWWEALKKLPHSLVIFPPRHHLFMGAYRKAPLPQKSWKTAVWFIDTRGNSVSPAIPPPGGEAHTGKKVLADLASELARLPMVDWSHGFLGGKPMCAPAQGTPPPHL